MPDNKPEDVQDIQEITENLKKIKACSEKDFQYIKGIIDCLVIKNQEKNLEDSK